MKNIKLAKRYASAMFDIALERNILDKAKQDFELIENSCDKSKEFRLLLESPIINQRKKIKIFEIIFENEISKEVLLFINLLVKKNREVYIKEMAQEFISIFKKFKNITVATIITAKSMNETIRQKIIKLLERETKSDIELIEEIDTKLIGGYVLLFDGKKYDASLRNRLNKITEEFNQNPYLKGF